MIGQIKGGWSWKLRERRGRKWKRERMQRRSTWPGETANSKGSHRWRRWVDLPNLGT